MNRRVIVLLVLALLAFGCAAEPESEIYPREVTLDSDLANSHGEEVQRAFDSWNERFPGCPHEIVQVVDLDPTVHEAGDLAVREFIPGADANGMFWLPSRSINVTYHAANTGLLVHVILHELGHGHGVHQHTATGVMGPTGEHSPDVAIDDTMAALVCAGDARCCDG